MEPASTGPARRLTARYSLQGGTNATGTGRADERDRVRRVQPSSGRAAVCTPALSQRRSPGAGIPVGNWPRASSRIRTLWAPQFVIWLAGPTRSPHTNEVWLKGWPRSFKRHMGRISQEGLTSPFCLPFSAANDGANRTRPRGRATVRAPCTSNARKPGALQNSFRGKRGFAFPGHATAATPQAPEGPAGKDLASTYEGGPGTRRPPPASLKPAENSHAATNTVPSPASPWAPDACPSGRHAKGEKPQLRLPSRDLPSNHRVPQALPAWFARALAGTRLQNQRPRPPDPIPKPRGAAARKTPRRNSLSPTEAMAGREVQTSDSPGLHLYPTAKSIHPASNQSRACADKPAEFPKS